MPATSAERARALNRAIERASAWLLIQAEHRFAEAAHAMLFPRAAGFTPAEDLQSADLFARATLAHLLLDIAESLPSSGVATDFRNIAAREADYLAASRLQDRAGGWSYFPGLPELPPDADSLAAVLSLFVRAAPQHLPLCEGPVQLVLDGIDTHGNLETWIVAPQDPAAARERMSWGIRNCWGRGTDADVLAHFHHALWLWAPDRYDAVIQLGAQRLADLQQSDGSWRATWYTGPAYGTALALRLLQEAGVGKPAVARALRFITDIQQSDGSWSEGRFAALQTALSMMALSHVDEPGHQDALRLGRTALLDRQLADGSWQASPWIQMEIGRAQGKVVQVATYKSATLTTAFCLRALATTAALE